MTPESMDENTLERLAQRLGESEAGKIDAEHVGRAVQARLGREGRTAARAWLRPQRIIQVAAALVIIAGASVMVTRFGGDAVEPFASLVPVALQDLADAELHEVLDSLEFDAPVSELVPVGLHDLSESELSELLETLEG